MTLRQRRRLNDARKDHAIAGNDAQHHLFSQILAFFREALAPESGR